MADIMQFDPRTLQPTDWAGSIARGYALPTNIQAQQTQNEMQKLQLQQAQAQQQAFKQYGQTGDVQAAMQADPRTGMALQDRQRKIMTEAVGLHDALKSSAYGNLDFYNKEYRPQMLKLGVPQTALPEYKTVQELNSGLYRNEQMAAQFKAMAAPGQYTPKAVAGMIYDPRQNKFIDPGVSEAKRQELAIKDRGVIAREKAVKAQGVKWFQDPVSGQSKAFAYGEQPPVNWKPIYKETDVDIPKWALDKATTAISKTDAYRDEKDPAIRKQMIFEDAKSLIQQREDLKTGKKLTRDKPFDLKAEGAARQQKINAMPPGPQRDAAQTALNQILQGK